jgi:hypothetical protein
MATNPHIEGSSEASAGASNQDTYVPVISLIPKGSWRGHIA